LCRFWTIQRRMPVRHLKTLTGLLRRASGYKILRWSSPEVNRLSGETTMQINPIEKITLIQ
jgi:hypothetical protein